MANPRPSASFKKGFDPRRNLKGRPHKGESLSEKFRDALSEKAEGDYTFLDAIIDTQIDKAIAGDSAAADWVISRGYGKLVDRIESNNINKNYDFTNLPMEERIKLLELLKLANPTIPSDNPDTK